MKEKANNVWKLALPCLIALALPSFASADTLKMQIENGSIAFSSEKLAESRFSCNYDANYSFTIPAEQPTDSYNVTKNFGECSARLEACTLEKEKKTVESERLTASGNALASCNKSAEIASYERLAFIGLFMLILVMAAMLAKRGKK